MASEQEDASREPDCRPEVIQVDMGLTLGTRSLPKFDKGLRLSVREAKLLHDPPWVRSLGKLNLEVGTDGWRFPAVQDAAPPPLPTVKAAAPKVAVTQAEFSLPMPVLPANGGTR